MYGRYMEDKNPVEDFLAFIRLYGVMGLKQVHVPHGIIFYIKEENKCNNH